MDVPMNDWRSLSEAASREQDPERLIMLVEQLNRVLQQRETLRKWGSSQNLHPFLKAKQRSCSWRWKSLGSQR